MAERLHLRGADRLPCGAALVDSRTRFGNPFRSPRDPALAVEAFRTWLAGGSVELAEGVELAFRPTPTRRRDILGGLPALRGWDLADTTPLVDETGRPVPSHVDVLLELANAPETDPNAAAAEAALAAAESIAPGQAGAMLVAALRAARDAELAQVGGRPFSARRAGAAYGGLAAAIAQRLRPARISP